MALSIDLFDYELPPELIAQQPSAQRDRSRLLVVDRNKRQVSHHRFCELGSFVHKGDTFFRNSVSVLPARLEAQRPSGGHVECFLLRPEDDKGLRWWCLLRPGKKLPLGACFSDPQGRFHAQVEIKNPDGSSLVRFQIPSGATVQTIANQLGQIPLPPYIGRADATAQREEDMARYQTVYANPTKQVAVAAPTAGLHFTPELLTQLETQGCAFEEIILHVGLGTFRPIMVEQVEHHDIHRERYEMPAKTQAALKSPQGRRIAVGTTSVRAIEDYLSKHSAPCGEAITDEAGIFIYPPRSFRGVDALVTNFHQPRSTLLCLVAAFLSPDSEEGISWLKDIYAEAIRERYRFFSYGDAMLIL